MRSRLFVVAALVGLSGAASAAESLPSAPELRASIVTVRGKLDADRAAMLRATPIATRYAIGAHALALLGVGVELGVCDVTSGASRRAYASCALSFKLGVGLGGGVQLGRERELGTPGMTCGEVLPAQRTKRQLFFAVGPGIAGTAGKVDEKQSPIASRQGFVGLGLGLCQDAALRLRIPLGRTVPSQVSRWIGEAAAALDAGDAALTAGDRATAAERLGRASFLRQRIAGALDPKPVEAVQRYSL